MPLETEIKLAGTPQRLAALAALPMLHGHGVRRTHHRLYTVYYDTPELELWHAGVALRMRREGERWIQTVKFGGGVEAGIHRRGEVETVVTGPLPDFTAIRVPALGRLFAQPTLRARVKPAFVTEFSRTLVVLEPAPRVAIEIAIDEGAIQAGERGAAIAEVELELKAGPVWRIYELAQALVTQVPLTIEPRSKAERGFALVEGNIAHPLKAGGSPVARDMTVGAALGAVIVRCLTQLQANQGGLIAGDRDPEYLHQARVALRRLRSALNAFRPALPRERVADLADELRWLAGTLGPARDLDVFCLERLPQVAQSFATHAGMGRLAQAARSLRRNANARARRALASARGQGLQLALARWVAQQGWRRGSAAAERAALAGSVRPFADAVLEKRYRRVRKRARGLAKLNDAELHELRILIKRLRYAGEFFAPLYAARPAKTFRDAAERLQDLLGHINDTATVAPLLNQAAAQARQPATREARAIVLGWTAHEAAQARAMLPRLWRELRKLEPFWR